MQIQHRYLEVTFRNGKALAAYLYLPREEDDASVRTQSPEPGLVIDFTADGRPIGIEIINPASITLEAINRVLAGIDQPLASSEELNPLIAA
jgi:hypothetical protein